MALDSGENEHGLGGDAFKTGRLGDRDNPTAG